MTMRWIPLFIVLCAGLLPGCGKSPEEKAGGASRPAASADTTSSSAIAASLRARGFQVVQERRAPAQRSQRRASSVVYRSPDGKSGGVVYVQRASHGSNERVGWHWFFSDAAPDSVVFAELNRDGLWDARVFMGGRSVDMIQGESFWLLGREHEGRGAMNGPSSARAEVWKCFDGDSTTVWRSPQPGAFIEIPVPTGLERGELDVQLPPEAGPARLDIYADGRMLQTIELSQGAGRRTFRLDPAARDAATIRIEVEGGSAEGVAISELEIR